MMMINIESMLIFVDVDTNDEDDNSDDDNDGR